MTDWYSAVGMFLRFASSCLRVSILLPAGGFAFLAMTLPRQGMQDADGPADVQALPRPARCRSARVQVEPVRFIPRSEDFHRIAAHLRGMRALGQDLAVGAAETKLAIRLSIELVALLVDGAMVTAAEQSKIRQRSGAAVSPVTDVMALAEANAAAGEAAAAVSVVERPPYRRRDRPGPGTDLDDMAVVAVSHHDPARVARDALGRFRGNARAVLQHGGVFLDVDHDLIAFSRSAGVEAVMERRLGEQRQSIGLLLAHRGRFRGNDGHVPVPQARLLVQGFSRCGHRLHEQGADFRCESSANRHHAVTILIHVKFPTHMLALVSRASAIRSIRRQP